MRPLTCAIAALLLLCAGSQKSAIPDAPYPTVEGMRTFINETGRTQPDILKQDPASFVDASIVKAIEDEGFLKRLGK